MFRRSKIKITPKIPQGKTNVDRANESSSTIQQPSESIDSSRLQQQQQQNINHQQQIDQPSNEIIQKSASSNDQPHHVQTQETPRSSGDDQSQVDQMTTQQAIPNQTSTSSSNDLVNHNSSNQGKQVTVDQTTSSDIQTTSLSTSTTAGSGTLNSSVSLNQIPGSQHNQVIPTRKINTQGLTTSITTRPSQPPPAPPSNPPSSNSSSGSTPTVGTPSRSRGQSLTKESLPPPPPPPATSSSGINGVARRDSLDNDQNLTTTIVREDSHSEPKRPRKRIKLTPDDLLDRNSITLYHLIHASITRTKKNDKKKTKDKKTDESTETENENIETNSEAGSNGLANSLETSRIDNEDTMDSIMTTASSASTIITGEPAVDETRERDSIGPRVKVGPDGQLIIDEESLVIKKPKPVETASIEEAVSGKTTYASFRKRPPTARWSKTETIEFYTALNLIGPDFSLMSNLFFNGKRTRTDLKNKFRRENKLNKPVIEKALYEADVEYCLAREAV